ncbi:MAG TPA: FAD:protein FMN transferase [Ignavibacteria bacterium]|nr:FAD:protein FMN transferase [Ignavibacteria bacterium]
MRETRILMGMPITVEVVDNFANEKEIDKIFSYFKSVDCKFSTYKEASEISLINKGVIKKENFSSDMKEIFYLAEETRRLTSGYFDIRTPVGEYDPSGIVKGWAVYKAAHIFKKDGFKNFYIDAGGDIQTFGKNGNGKKWKVGIRNPFNVEEIIKIVELSGEGIATSGSYIRGDHIYNPNNRNHSTENVASLTIIAPNVYEADRFTTAAYAMGDKGVSFIESLKDSEGYVVDNNSIATFTSNFEKYAKK